MRNIFNRVFLLVIIGAAFSCKNPLEPVPADEAAPVDQRFYGDAEWWWERHAACANRASAGGIDMVFFGDSLTHGWESQPEVWAGIESPYRAANFGFAGDTTRQVIWRIENGEFPQNLHPEYVVLLIGSNNSGLLNDDPIDTSRGIYKIIELLHARSAGTKIILVSLLPRGDDVEVWERNKEVNKRIQAYDGVLNVNYLDIHDDFLKADGTIDTRFFIEDKAHLGKDGYTLWKDKLLEFLQNSG